LQNAVGGGIVQEMHVLRNLSGGTSANMVK
jgi:hypothetical protein